MVTPTRRRIDSQERVQADMEAGAVPSAPAVYPVQGERLALAPETVAAVADVLASAGWPAMRHESDFLRLVVALRWVATGGAPVELRRAGGGR